MKFIIYCIFIALFVYIIYMIRNILHIKTKDGTFMDCIYSVIIIYMVIFAIWGFSNVIDPPKENYWDTHDYT